MQIAQLLKEVFGNLIIDPVNKRELSFKQEQRNLKQEKPE